MSKLKYTFEQFEDKARIVHGNKFTYYPDSFNGISKLIELSCNKCSYHWFQQGRDHLKGRGCPSCVGNIRYTIQDVINKSKLLYPNKFDYSNFKEYINNKSNIYLICNTCKLETIQRVDDHLNGHGYCKYCDNGKSKYEQDLTKFISSFGFSTINNKRYNWLGHLELDILIPELNLAIEFNGTHYHSSLFKDSLYHLNKYELCKQNGITLIHVFEFEDLDKWKRKLKLYFENRFRYKIDFQNNKRSVYLSNTKYTCYGQSYIKLSY